MIIKKLVAISCTAVLVFSNVMSVSAATLEDIFDEEYYVSTYQDVAEAFGNDERALYQHFREYGLKEGRAFNKFFNVQVYRQRYQDLDEAFGDDWDAYFEHYLTFGIYEKRSPAENGAIFDIEYYKETYPDVVATLGENPALLLEHYIKHGIDEGRFSEKPAPEPVVSAEAKNSRLGQRIMPASLGVIASYQSEDIEDLEETETVSGSDWTWVVIGTRTRYFNKNGNEIQMIETNLDGTALAKYVYEYDANNTMIKVTGYENGRIRFTDVYDSNGDGIEGDYYLYNDNGTLSNYFYNGGNVEWSESFDENGNLESYGGIEYADDGSGYGVWRYVDGTINRTEQYGAEEKPLSFYFYYEDGTVSMSTVYDWTSETGGVVTSVINYPSGKCYYEVARKAIWELNEEGGGHNFDLGDFIYSRHYDEDGNLIEPD